MIHRIRSHENIFECNKAQIIYNPVSVLKGEAGNRTFNLYLKEKYPETFRSYLDCKEGISKKKLLGEIDIVEIPGKRFVLNSFIFTNNRKIDIKAMIKTFVELFNIGEEYHLNIAIPTYLNSRSKDTKELLLMIENVIFEDYREEVYLYDSIIRRKDR